MPLLLIPYQITRGQIINLQSCLSIDEVYTIPSLYNQPLFSPTRIMKLVATFCFIFQPFEKNPGPLLSLTAHSKVWGFYEEQWYRNGHNCFLQCPDLPEPLWGKGSSAGGKRSSQICVHNLAGAELRRCMLDEVAWKETWDLVEDSGPNPPSGLLNLCLVLPSLCPLPVLTTRQQRLTPHHYSNTSSWCCGSLLTGAGWPLHQCRVSPANL